MRQHSQFLRCVITCKEKGTFYTGETCTVCNENFNILKTTFVISGNTIKACLCFPHKMHIGEGSDFDTASGLVWWVCGTVSRYPSLYFYLASAQAHIKNLHTYFLWLIFSSYCFLPFCTKHLCILPACFF